MAAQGHQVLLDDTASRSPIWDIVPSAVTLIKPRGGGEDLQGSAGSEKEKTTLRPFPRKWPEWASPLSSWGAALCLGSRVWLTVLPLPLSNPGTW